MARSGSYGNEEGCPSASHCRQCLTPPWLIRQGTAPAVYAWANRLILLLAVLDANGLLVFLGLSFAEGTLVKPRDVLPQARVESERDDDGPDSDPLDSPKDDCLTPSRPRPKLILRKSGFHQPLLRYWREQASAPFKGEKRKNAHPPIFRQRGGNGQTERGSPPPEEPPLCRCDCTYGLSSPRLGK